MAEGDGLEPLDADVDAIRIVAPGNFEVLALGGTSADENGVIALVEQRLHALDAVVQSQVHAHVEDVADLFVEHIRRQAELRNIGAHQAAGRLERLEDRDLVAEWTKVVGDRQRGAARADQCHLLAIVLRRRLRQAIDDVVAMVGGNAFQPANCDWLVLDATAATRRFAGAIADPAEDARKDVGLAIFHVRIAELSLGDQANVLRHVGMRRTAVLAVNDLVEILGIGDVGRLHRNRASITVSARK